MCLKAIVQKVDKLYDCLSLTWLSQERNTFKETY